MTFIAKMKWGAAGQWNYPDRYTTEPTEAVPMYWFYLLLGHLAAYLKIPLPVIYHVATALLGGLAVVMLWQLTDRYSKYPLIAFLLAIFASGGIILDLVDTIFKTDLAHLDGFLQGHIYLSLRAFPHYIVDLIAVLAIFYAYLNENMKPKYLILLAAIGGFMLSAIHPFLLALVPVVFVYAVLVNRSDIKKALLINVSAFIAATPLTLLLINSMLHIPWFNEWRNQTATSTTPNPLVFLVGIYGLSGVLGWLKAISELQKPSIWTVWLFTASIMAYLIPIKNNYEITFFLSLPLGMLSAEWLGGLVDRVHGLKAHKTAKHYVSTVIVLLFIWPGLSYIPGIFISSSLSNKYLPASYVNELKSLDNSSRYGTVVLCNLNTGNVIPAYTENLKPYIGHQLETLHYESKVTQVDAFFSGRMSKAEAMEFLQTIKARWVIYDRVLPEKSADYTALKNMLGEPFYNNKALIVWEVCR
ncbi:hypothetical protein [Desulfotruncus alcoholivorax]|uniref:hypothetical protein n=1 Tax=Desulfotruncus alcoholivorax TaxID=265477 RepID=UPI0012FE95E0|nr:hypothetical protein [Desulfotruncus alcoholivorax]